MRLACFPMRSDPLLLAQTMAEGKQRVESNFDVHGRVERTSERSCATEKAAASELISSLRHTHVRACVCVCVSLFASVPACDLPHARSGVNSRFVKKRAASSLRGANVVAGFGGPVEARGDRKIQQR